MGCVEFYCNEYVIWQHEVEYDNSRVSCQKGPTHHAYAWQIGLELYDIL